MRTFDSTDSVDFTLEQPHTATPFNHTSVRPHNPGLSELDIAPEEADTLVMLVRPGGGSHPSAQSHLARGRARLRTRGSASRDQPF